MAKKKRGPGRPPKTETKRGPGRPPGKKKAKRGRPPKTAAKIIKVRNPGAANAGMREAIVQIEATLAPFKADQRQRIMNAAAALAALAL